VNRLRAEYGVTLVVYNLNITFALVGVALAMLFLAPLIDITHRKMATLSSWFLFIVLNIGSAFVNNLGGLVVIRFFTFLFGGSAVYFLSVDAMTLSKGQDTRNNRPLYISMATSFPLLGIVMGPVVGGLIEGHNVTPDWSRYLIPIVAFAAILPYAFFGSSSLQTAAPSSTLPQSYGQRIKGHYRHTLKRLFTLNTREPILIAITLYLSQLYFFFLITLVAFPYAFGRTRGYNATAVALTYLSLVVGVLLSMLVPLLSGCKTRRRTSSHIDHDIQPEAVLKSSMLFGPLIPIGLFIFAWTANSVSTSVAAPMVGMILFSFAAGIAITDHNVYLANI
jgi:MFS family permease